jgi:hypothetical protein
MVSEGTSGPRNSNTLREEMRRRSTWRCRSPTVTGWWLAVIVTAYRVGIAGVLRQVCTKVVGVLEASGSTRLRRGRSPPWMICTPMFVAEGLSSAICNDGSRYQDRDRGARSNCPRAMQARVDGAESRGAGGYSLEIHSPDEQAAQRRVSVYGPIVSPRRRAGRMDGASVSNGRRSPSRRSRKKWCVGSTNRLRSNAP